MHWRRNPTLRENNKPDLMYSQIEQALKKFVENWKITGNVRNIAGITYLKQCAILLKAIELLELLKSGKSEGNSAPQESGLNDSKRSEDVHDCSNMSLTLTTIDECLLDDVNEPDTTTYLDDMEITFMESSLLKTPKSTIRSILKSAQREKSNSARRKVRFEDELEETLAEIIENKENLNWGPKVVEAENGCVLRVNNNNLSRQIESSVATRRSKRPVSKVKANETSKNLNCNDKQSASWVTSRKQSADLKALRDMKTLVEIENERREMKNRSKKDNEGNSSSNKLNSGIESIEKTPSIPCSPVLSGFSIDDLDITKFLLSETPRSVLELDSLIFE